MGRSHLLLLSYALGSCCTVTTESPYRSGAESKTVAKAAPQPLPEPGPPTTPERGADVPRPEPPAKAALPPAVQPLAQPSIEVISAGASKRESLRRTAKVGAQQRLSLVVRPHMKVTRDGKPSSEQELPAVTLTLESRVASVAENGAAHLAIGVVAAEFDPAAGDERARRASERQMAALRDLAIELDLRPDGMGEQFRVAVPSRPESDVRATVEAVLLALPLLFVPTPVEPVGVGAKWKAITGYSYAGLALLESAEIELVKRTAEVVELAWTATLTQEQPAAGPGRAVETASVAARGTASISADHPLVVRLSSTASGEMTSTVHTSGAAEKAGLALELVVEVAADN
jgi:hypothetical protein